MVAGLCSFARGRERVTLCAPATVSVVDGHEIDRLVLHPGVFVATLKSDAIHSILTFCSYGERRIVYVSHRD